VATAQEPLSQAASSFFSDLDTREQDDGLSAFAGVRARLFGIAYRMLGNAADAEDIVQDVWLRWHLTNRRAVLDPPAFLATTATRLCINYVQSARSRHETSIEARLLEPVDTTCNPGLGAERSEALLLAMLLLVEKLSPTERAVLILREAFDYSYRRIAELLQLGEDNARQLFSRARRHITDGRRTAAGSGDQRQLLKTFINAAQKGEMAALEGLLAADVASCSFGIEHAA
jgi:RNA polymerase sigma factor (sigma-70 family)